MVNRLARDPVDTTAPFHLVLGRGALATLFQRWCGVPLEELSPGPKDQLERAFTQMLTSDPILAVAFGLPCPADPDPEC